VSSAPALAKLTRPRLQAVAPRPRLFRRLDELAGCGVVWVEGPPGSGKTTLVASWLERARGRALWYRLDDADGDPATFFHFMSSAVRRLARTRAVWPRYRPGAAVDVPTFARHFFRALFASLGGSFVLVLDDYQELPGGSPLNAVIRAALSERPTGARAVILSRTGPPPALARLRATGEMERLGPEELLLTPRESAAVIRLRRRGCAAAVCEALHVRSGGWAAGLTLLLAAGDGGRDPIRGLGGSREIFQYFAGEVLDRADREVRQVLLETALLPQVSAAAARELTGIASADRILADLAHGGYFTIRHGDGAVYTFHPLFREFLVERARRELSAERLARVRTEAAAQAARSDAVVEAFALLREAGADDEAAQLVRDRAESLLDAGRSATLRRLILELPAPLRDEAWLSYWFGASFHGVDLELARTALERAHAAFVERGDAAGAFLACAAMLDSYALEWVDFRPLERWIGAFEALRRRWPEFPGEDVAARAACGIFSALSAVRPDDPELPRWQERVEVIASAEHETTARESARFALAQFAIWRGDLHAIRPLLATATRRARGLGRDPAFEIGWLVQAARAAATSGDGDAALALVEEALGMAETTGNTWWDVGSRLVGVWAATIVQDDARARAYLGRMERDFDASMQTYLVQARALTRLRAGDRAAAREDLLGALALDHGRAAVYAESWDHVALASIAAHDGDEGTLERHRQEAERLATITRSRIVRYWLLLLDTARMAARDRSAAARLATEAMRLSREAGPFDEMWIDRAALAFTCALALDAGAEVEEARGVVARRRLGLPHGVTCDAWPHPVALRTLGSFSLERCGTAARVPTRTRPVQLLKALVALGGKEIEEWKLTDALWPDAEADLAQHALEMNLSRLRKLLGSHEVVTQTERKLSLDATACWVDADALEAVLAAAAGRTAEAEVEPVARRVLALYRGPFLAADDGPWARARRDRIRRRLRTFRDALGVALQRAGRFEDATAFSREMSRRDPELCTAPAAPLAI
jgi:ATP/maltotriose-dependent transcriptional regulator MalT